MTDRSPLVGSSADKDAADRLEAAGEGEGECTQGHNNMSSKEDVIGSKCPLLDDMKTDLLSYLNEYFGWFCPLQTPLVKRHSEEVSTHGVNEWILWSE